MAANLNRLPCNLLEGFESWLETLRLHLLAHRPELVKLFDVFANEALFGRKWLTSSLDFVPAGARLLEVGGGLMLLSCQLVREGYNVTVIEPVGEGFSSFTELQEIVLRLARESGCSPEVLPVPAEEFSLEKSFDFAFSVNVMEHVGDVRGVMKAICKGLRPGSQYRFTCPNYLFPYEPHFNIPTFFSKKLTERLLCRRIFESSIVSDPSGMWRSLNWINVVQIRQICASLLGVQVQFSTRMLADSLERVIFDPTFASRRSRWVVWLAGRLVTSRIHRLTCWLPAVVLPVIDCTVSVSN